MVTHYFDSHGGGIELVAGRLAREFGRAGRAVVWLAGETTPPPSGREWTGSTVGVRTRNLTEQLFGIPYPLLGPAGIDRIAKAVREADIVMVHDTLYLTSAAALLFARRHRKPTVVVQHVGAVPYRNRLFRTLMRVANRVIARPLLRGADRVAFVSEITAGHFATVRFRAAPTVIFSGVDSEVFRPASKDMRALLRRRQSLPADRPVALFVGRFVEKKGLYILRELAARRTDLHWAFAGKGPLDPRRWGLPNVTVFEGLSGVSLAALYQACDVLVLPSVGEGYPLVVQEALACGLPVACGDDTARADPAARPLLAAVAISGGSPVADAASFSDAVDRILGAADDRAAATRRQFAAERYSWTACTRQYLGLIDAVADDRLAGLRPNRKLA